MPLLLGLFVFPTAHCKSRGDVHKITRHVVFLVDLSCDGLLMHIASIHDNNRLLMGFSQKVRALKRWLAARQPQFKALFFEGKLFGGVMELSLGCCCLLGAFNPDFVLQDVPSEGTPD
jgi:hypothetical protein